MSADVGDALLGFRFASGLGLRWKREDSCFLPFAEPRQQHDLAIGELERVMMKSLPRVSSFSALSSSSRAASHSSRVPVVCFVIAFSPFVGRLCAFENAASIDANLAICIGQAGSLACQAAAFGSTSLNGSRTAHDARACSQV